MTSSKRPLLTLGNPETAKRPAGTNNPIPKVKGPGSRIQGERLSPQFKELMEAFEKRRVQLSTGITDEIDPELVLVFDLAGTIDDFRNAVERIDGLEFLAELLDADTEPDEEFHMEEHGKGRTEKPVARSLQLVLSNAAAAKQLVKLFETWTKNKETKFPHGQTKFRYAFEQLHAIRPWGPSDRIRETGLAKDWQEKLELIGQSQSSVRVEVELWYRKKTSDRNAAEAHLRSLIAGLGGRTLSRAEIPEIAYHALLVELPIQQVEEFMDRGADSMSILTADEVMFVLPSEPMSVTVPAVELTDSQVFPTATKVIGLPRIALLDGLPMRNHEALAGRLSVDDPDLVADDYLSVSDQWHGTTMASLIIHGDLSAPGPPLDRKLYVRPIMRPHSVLSNKEQVLDEFLFPDLLHRAIRRIVDGEGDQPAAAPSVRLVNISIGSETRAFVRKMSPVGRLLDWLAIEKNLLFVVSAGNHSSRPLTIPAEDADTLENAKIAALRAARSLGRQRGMLPPGDALNALTVGAVHDDAAGDLDLPDQVWDLTDNKMPSLYGAVGPGVDRSIKPDISHSGGRAVYIRPVHQPGSEAVELPLANTPALPPGTKVAAPGLYAKTDSTAYTHGTSNAAALVTREASRLFDILEAGADLGDPQFPDPQYHPILVKALLVHASSWGERAETLQKLLCMNRKDTRHELSALLGYGALDLTRVGNAATNRAVLIAAGSIAGDQMHTYQIPLPPSLRAQRDWHRVTVTLAYMSPIAPRLNRYRGTKLFFEYPDDKVTGGARAEAISYDVLRGSCQHEIIQGEKAMIFEEGESLPLFIKSMKDAQRLGKDQTVRYGLVVSIETKVETSTTIHDEVRAALRTQIHSQAHTRVHQQTINTRPL